MKDMTTLQRIIETAAEKRLEDDVQQLREMMLKSSIVQGCKTHDSPLLGIPRHDTKDQEFVALRGFVHNNKYWAAVKDYLLPGYIEEETKTFVAKVNNIQEQLDILMSTE